MGKGWLLTRVLLKTNELLYVSPSGETKEVWNASNALSMPVPSPDGAKIAVAVSSQDSNAWMLENF